VIFVQTGPFNDGVIKCLRFYRRHLFWMLVVETVAKIRRLSLVRLART
jgi:hypothetical protein